MCRVARNLDLMKKLLYALSILLLLLAAFSRIANIEGFSIPPLVGLVGLAIGMITWAIDRQNWFQ